MIRKRRLNKIKKRTSAGVIRRKVSSAQANPSPTPIGLSPMVQLNKLII